MGKTFTRSIRLWRSRLLAVMKDELRKFIYELINETQKDLDKDREVMSKEDIYYDEGYINALTYISSRIGRNNGR